MRLKQQLIQQNPDLQEMIVTTVDEKTMELAGRRADLEREVALAYARVYSEAANSTPSPPSTSPKPARSC